jgi:hypothetical protein
VPDAGYLSWLYGTALLIAALLLFWVQPLYTKMALPYFGGAPAVWTTASMFFQCALLAGYLYAHVLSRSLGFRPQVLVHFALLALVFALLPFKVDPAAVGDAAQDPLRVLLALFGSGVGLPFLAIAATAPLLQRWFSHTLHAEAADPYFLYAASNTGSMLALVGFPLVIEPALGLARQSQLWSAGYALLALLLATCAAGAWRHGAAAHPPAEPAAATVGPAWRERALWLALAFVPTSLMLGVTQHVSSEIAAVPLMWVVPLALYVATFINAFARRPPLRLAWTAPVQPLLVVALVLVWTLNIYASVFLVHLLSFVVTALMCHGELARRRPAADHLTEFYLWIAVGGALGGAFNAVAAPLLFDSIVEYPLAIAVACMLRPVPHAERRLRWSDLGLPAALAAGLGALIHFGVHPLRLGTFAIVFYLETIGVILYFARARPVRFGLAVAVVLLAQSALHVADEVLVRHRSFFGVHTVLKDETGKFHVLLNGITVHGAQHLDEAKRHEPTTFYHRDGPLGQLFLALGKDSRIQRVALVGLGTGSAVCHRASGRIWQIYEIDPVVVQLARDTRFFDFLAACAPQARVAVGDGRLGLAQAVDGSLDLIILDTFSSDAIPVHMVTREAIELYFRKLAPRGVLMLHISNQYLDLAPVISNIAAGLGLAALVPGPRLSLPFDGRFSQMESNWIAIGRSADDLAALIAQEGWRSPEMRPSVRPWTDDYSNILQALK